jgi:transposase
MTCLRRQNLRAGHSETEQVPGVKAGTQDGHRLRRYEQRWVVERFIAWIQLQRRFLVSWEYYAENFHGFVQLASIAILLKQF